MPPSSAHPKPLAAAVVILLLLIALPVRWTGFLNQCSTIAELIVGPVSGPVSTVSGWLLPRSPGRGNDAALAHAEAEAKRYEMLYLQSQATIRDLQGRIAELSSTRSLPGDSPISLVQASVIGASPDPAAGLLQVRAGRAQGVEINTVAVVAGVQLLGRVEDVDDRTAWVRVITTPRPNRPIPALICIGDDPDQWLDCNLFAQPGGSLKGVFEYKAGMSERVVPGLEVRLSDQGGHWPPSARMLLVGTIDSIESTTNLVGRYAIVRPTVDRLELVTEVTLRVPLPEGAGPVQDGPSEGRR
jgi:cell shape-determining protein MreC